MPDRDREVAVDPADPARVRRAAMDLLARREHSLHELQLKLQRRFPDRQVVDGELRTADPRQERGRNRGNPHRTVYSARIGSLDSSDGRI